MINPILIFNAVSWFPIEFSPIFAGWIGPSEIAVNIILNNIYFLVMHIPFSISLTIAAFVGNSLGENLPKKAILHVKTSLLLILLCAAPVMLGLWIFQHQLASLYTNDSEVIELFKIILLPFILYNIGEFLFYTTEGILIGVGYQKILVFLIFFWMWVFMIPSTLCSIFVFKYKLFEMWVIFCIARICLSLSNMIIIFITNWTKEAEEASKHVVDKE